MSEQIEPQTEPETKTVIGTPDAERLQKQGWILLDAKIIGTDENGLTKKSYTFRKDKT